MASIWIISAFDPLPGELPPPRRYFHLATILKNQGHHITYWAPTFSHLLAEQRPNKDFSEEGISFRLFPSKSYPIGMLSMRRLLVYRQWARSLISKLSAFFSTNSPQLIVLAYPPISIAKAVAAWAKEQGIPLHVDVQDMWPLSWFSSGPSWFRWLLQSISTKVTAWPSALAHAQSISTVSPELEAAILKHVSSAKLIHVCPIGISSLPGPTSAVRSPKSIAVLGQSQPQYLFKWLAPLASHLSDYQFYVWAMIPGHLADLPPNVKILGFLPEAELHSKISECSIGLMLIPPHKFASLPNRLFSYWAAGLKVVTNVQDPYLKSLLVNQQWGIATDFAEPTIAEIASAITVATTIKSSAEDIQSQTYSMFSRDKLYHTWAEFLLGTTLR